MSEINKEGIKLLDVRIDCSPIKLLLGSDVYGRLLTSKKGTLSSGVTAIETKLGWTISRIIPGINEHSMPMCVLSICCHIIKILRDLGI